MAFQESFDKIRDGISDLSQLNVRTFTGEIEVSAKKLPAAGVSLGSFLETADIEGTIQVVGFTDMKIDGDIDQFITSSPLASAIAAHNSAVQAGQQSRKAMVDLFVKQIKAGIELVK